MKIWKEYGSEHSNNLVMIGKFKTVSDARKVKEIINIITEKVDEEIDKDIIKLGIYQERFSDDMHDLLRDLKVHSFSPVELEQFAYEARIDNRDKNIIIKTDEIDVSVYLKLLIDKGASVEIFSAHDYPEKEQS